MTYWLIIAVIVSGAYHAHSEPAAATNAVAPQKDGQLRDPFWPVGYWPSAENEVKEKKPIVPKAKVNWPKLTVRATSRDAQVGYRALLDPVGMVKPGQDIKIVRGKLVYMWHITAIDATGVKYRKTGVRPLDEAEQGTGQPKILIRRGTELFKRPPDAAGGATTE